MMGMWGCGGLENWRIGESKKIEKFFPFFNECIFKYIEVE